MDILNGKYRVVGVAPKDGKAEIVTKKAGTGLRRIDLLAIDEATAETLIANDCRFVEKVEPVAKKGSSEKVS